jgi:hypothetical protein
MRHASPTKENTMKRIVTHVLVAAGLVLGAVGAAQAHTDLNIGLSLGAPVYARPTAVYVQPAPYYRAAPPEWRRHDEPRWGGQDRGRWDRTGWDHRGNNGGDNRGDNRGDYRGGWDHRG